MFNLFTCQQTRGDQSNKKKKGRLSRKEGAQKSPKKENREFLLAKGKFLCLRKIQEICVLTAEFKI